MGTDGPSAIRSLAVSTEDVVDAFVYDRENPASAVLRVTPPFHGRMRARIHVYHVDDADATGAIHVPPRDLLSEAVRAAYPTLESFAAEDDAGDRYAEAIERWRERARDAIADRVVLETDDGPREVSVTRLG